MPSKTRLRSSSGHATGADNVCVYNNVSGNILSSGNSVSERLLAYRRKHRMGYAKLAALIGDINPMTVRKAIRGGSLSEITLFKINDFLAKVEVSA